MRRVTKLFNTKASSIDEAKKTVTFRISDNKPDRMGEIVDQKSWDFKSYMKNPIVLWGHDPSEPENVLGTSATLAVDSNGGYTDADITFDTEINPKAALVFNQVKAGTLKTVSVGFVNHDEDTNKDGIPVLKNNELLEISIVPIPANPRAVALSLKEGTLSRKDAKWLLDSMTKESALLEAQLKQEEGDSKVDQSEQIEALTEAIGKLTESVDELTGENAELKATVDALQADDAAQPKTPPAAASDTVDDENKEPVTPPADKSKDDPKDDPANGGSDDQPGAGDVDEVDPEAELTPEIQAQLDSALQNVEPATT